MCITSSPASFGCVERLVDAQFFEERNKKAASVRFGQKRPLRLLSANIGDVGQSGQEAAWHLHAGTSYDGG
jgi:hypothetical protein